LQTSARITDIASARVYALLTLVATKIDVACTVGGRGFTGIGRKRNTLDLALELIFLQIP